VSRLPHTMRFGASSPEGAVQRWWCGRKDTPGFLPFPHEVPAASAPRRQAAAGDSFPRAMAAPLEAPDVHLDDLSDADTLREARAREPALLLRVGSGRRSRASPGGASRRCRLRCAAPFRSRCRGARRRVMGRGTGHPHHKVLNDLPLPFDRHEAVAGGDGGSRLVHAGEDHGDREQARASRAVAPGAARFVDPNLPKASRIGLAQEKSAMLMKPAAGGAPPGGPATKPGGAPCRRGRGRSQPAV
jgi:hypothetical protein